MRPGRALGRPVVILAVGAALLLSGCARSTSQSDLEKAKAAGASEQLAKQQQASVAAEIQKLKEDLAKAKSQTATPTPSSTQPQILVVPQPQVVPRAQTAQGASCGGGVSVGANTSCAFASNVASALAAAGGGSQTLSVYSPTTGKYYTMTWVAGVPTVCRGGNNATVYIR